jgi:hypothetical protein
MAQEIATRFDDLVLDAVTAIQAMARRGTGWDAAELQEKGRVVELGRGLAGERRYALKVGDAALVDRLEALRASARAQLRILEAKPSPGDDELAARLESDVAEYARVAGREAPRPRRKPAATPKPARKKAKAAATKRAVSAPKSPRARPRRG